MRGRPDITGRAPAEATRPAGRDGREVCRPAHKFTGGTRLQNHGIDDKGRYHRTVALGAPSPRRGGTGNRAR
jgi:hypothetical protein